MRGSGYVFERQYIDNKFGEITQSKRHYAVQGHLRSPISYTTSY